MKNSKEIAQECFNEITLQEASNIAVNSDYTQAVFQAAIEIAYTAGAGQGYWSPSEFREAVNSRAHQIFKELTQ